MKIKFYTKEEIDIIEDSLINNPKNTLICDDTSFFSKLLT